MSGYLFLPGKCTGPFRLYVGDCDYCKGPLFAPVAIVHAADENKVVHPGKCRRLAQAKWK